ncbi:MAG: alkane 1-monooxygenase [Flammeovirgaceae bacterium]|nr:MAG: alkane 1-monooxygenase [Flammeovirgaceae bacterium]
MAKKIGFFTAFIIPALVIAGFYLDGYWNYLAIVFAFIIIPVIDQASGLDTTNVEPQRVKVVSEEFFYRFVTYLWTFIQLAFILWGFYAVTSGKINTLPEWIGFTISFALVTGGIGITVAHELGHKKSRLERFYSKLLLMTVCYMHFYIEHNQGHHVLVATPHDPATARKNENFYAFWFRSVFLGYAHAWQLELARLNRKNLPVLHPKNQMIWFALLPVLFCLVFTLLASYLLKRPAIELPAFFFAQSILAFTLLELVNYVEHYGIERKEIAPGRYERVNPLHSWNASHLISNFFLFQLQRHSDHHANAIKRYQVLNHYDESPQLPFGYPTMILIALLPPLWFSMMNKRLESWQQAAVPSIS